MNVYDWEGSDEHKAAILKAFNVEDDAHQVVATQFGITRTEAKMANWRLAYGGKPLAECEGARQNEIDGAAMLQQSSIVDATRVVATECLLSDMHHSLNRGERCPECGYCFEEIG